MFWRALSVVCEHPACMLKSNLRMGKWLNAMCEYEHIHIVYSEYIQACSMSYEHLPTFFLGFPSRCCPVKHIVRMSTIDNCLF